MIESAAIITSFPQNQRKNLANDSDLEKIRFPVTVSPHKLNKLERRWFGYFLALAKMRYCGVAVSIDKLTREEFRVNGQTCSERTTHRALEGLALKGILRRRKNRIGPNRFRTVIRFNMEAFAFYLKRDELFNKYPTGTYFIPQLPNWQEDIVSSNSGYLPCKSVSKPVYKQTSYQNNIPIALMRILITLRCILTGPQRKTACIRAEREMSTGNYVSGVDWDYWADRWNDFLFDRRDATAEREIVPLLLDKNYGRQKRGGNIDSLVTQINCANVQCRPERSPPCREHPPPIRDHPPPDPREEVPDWPVEDIAELKILLEARARAQARQREDWFQT